MSLLASRGERTSKDRQTYELRHLPMTNEMSVRIEHRQRTLNCTRRVLLVRLTLLLLWVSNNKQQQVSALPSIRQSSSQTTTLRRDNPTKFLTQEEPTLAATSTTSTSKESNATMTTTTSLVGATQALTGRRPHGEVPLLGGESPSSSVLSRPVTFSLHHPQQSKLRRQQQQQQQQQQTFISCLAVLSGVVDVLSYRTFGYYCNMMTGNSIRLATSLAEGQWRDALLFATMLSSYAGGVGFYRCMHHLVTSNKNKSVETAPVRSSTTLSSPTTSSTTLRYVATASLLLFALGDVVLGRVDASIQLPLFAAAFGMINASALACTNVVVNAATGHLTRSTMGMIDAVVCSRNNNDYCVEKSSAAASMSTRFLMTFLSSIVVTTLLYNGMTALSHQYPVLFAGRPPLGTTMGVLYFLLLQWYSRMTSKQEATL